MDEYSGEKFLDELYENYFKEKIYIKKEYNDDLKKYKYVRKNYENKKEQYEDVRKYLSKLGEVHSSKYKETLKGFYYEEYVIKEEVLREKIKKQYGDLTEERMQEIINPVITAQKTSLDKWIDYLSNDAAYYPVWAKYWAFQGMLGMGVYDEGIEGYQKRSKDTEIPFVDANPEIIAKAIEIVVQKVREVYGDKNPSRNDIEKLKQEVNFSKLYAVLEKKYVSNVIEYSGTEGIWKKYNQGSKEEAIKLNKDIQNKNTHWCTAASESMAIKQICGPYDNASEGGDFYVYYTKDKKGNYTLPRIAIRMSGHDEIGEIRGVLDGQNLEEEMTPILEEKLNEMTFLTEKSKKDAFEKLDGLRELTRIYQKTTKKEELTEEEINNLYTKKYGFGWEQDPKVEKIIKKRNLTKDFETVKKNDVKIEIMEFAYKRNMNFQIKEEAFIKHFLEENRLNYKFKYLKYAMKYFNPKYSEDYDALVNQAIIQNGFIMEYVKPDDVKDYDELAKKAVTELGTSIKYISVNDVSNYDELAKLAVTSDGSSIVYINPEDVEGYNEIANLAIIKDPASIGYIKPKYVTNYEELAEKAVENYPSAIGYINPKSVKKYEELARKAVAKDATLIEKINPEDVKDYNELANLVVSKEPMSIGYIKPKYVTNYDELAKKVVELSSYNIVYISPNASNYEELAKLAVTKSGTSIVYINPKDVTDYDELARLAVISDPNSIDYIRPETVTDYTELEELALNKKEKTNLKKSLQKIGKFLKNIKNQNNENDNNDAPRMGFIDILSLTTLVMTLGIVILIVIKIFNK